MSRLFTLPLKYQLAFLFSLLGVFATGIILYSGLVQRERVLLDARQEAESLAALLTVRQQCMVSATEQLMLVLSRMPEVKNRQVGSLETLLGQIIKQNPEYSTIFVTDRSGEIWASALPIKFLRISDQETFNRALERGRFTSGQYRKGQFSGRQILSFYYPYRGSNGEIAGQIILGVDLDYLWRAEANSLLPLKANYLLMDYEGVILDAGIHPEFIGRMYGEEAFARMRNGPETDTVIGVGLDRQKRLVCYRKLRLPGEAEPYLYVRAGVPLDAVLSQANRELIGNLAIFLSALLAVLGLGWFVGKRSITDRVALLEKSSLRLAEGDLTVRVGALVPGGELGTLARNFDHMAEQLAQRARDISDSRATLRQIIDTLPQAIFWKDRASVYLGCNKNFLQSVGLAKFKQIVGRTDYDLPWLRAEAEAYRRDDQEVIAGNRAKRHIIEPLQRADGERLWVDTTKVPLLDKEGQVVGLLGVYEDITERKLAEEALRRSEEFIRKVLDTVDEGFIVVDREYKIVTANKAFCGQLGRTCEELVGKSCLEVAQGAFKPCHGEGEECAVRRVFETGQPQAARHSHADSGGRLIHVETKAFPLQDEKGEIISVVEMITDITEKITLEEERFKRQKIEAIGTLAGGIAHDFRNLLQGVFGFMSLAKGELDREGEAYTLLAQAERALQLTMNLTSQLLTFAKGGSPAKERLDLVQVIETSARFALSGSPSSYSFSHDEDLLPVDADPGQLAQVVQNIVLNASQAMPEGGIVEISLRNLELKPGENPLLPGGGRFVAIVIEDSGSGIPEEYRAKIFDPYFTSKEDGSGLGLATSYSIVQKHGGAIEVKSRQGKGSAFFIYLPCSEAEEREEVQVPVPEVVGKKRILLMDDEKMVREVAVRMVEALGHEITCAQHGEEAIELFGQARQSGNPFDLVILDLTVKGGMGGEQAAAILRQMEPQVKLVVSSGYSDNSLIADYQAHGFARALNKPYLLEDLRACINSLLG